MQEQIKRGETETKENAEENQGAQFDAMARNMVRLFDQGAKVFSTLAERSRTNGQGPYGMGSDVGEAAKSLGEVARHWISEPRKLAAAQGELLRNYADLWGRSVRR